MASDEHAKAPANGVDGWSSAAARARFLALDALLQDLVDATHDVDSVRVSVTLVAGGQVVGGPATKEYHRRG